MLFPPHKPLTRLASWALIFFFLLSGCQRNTEPPGVTPSEIISTLSTETPQPTATVTPTPEPLALRVNDEGVPLAEFQAQLTQLEAADEVHNITRTAEERRQMVLDELIDQTLLAQVAVEGGFKLSEEELQARIDSLAQHLGGQAALEEWIATNGYTQHSFRTALWRAAASAWQRDVVINTVPLATEQVKAQQILVGSAETAQNLHRQLEAGADFATLAAQVDPITAGMLGWFPRGYLTQPAIEEAAFALQPGEFSPIIETNFGYHIVYVLEREMDRTLTLDARTTLQHKVLAAWLEAQREASQIEILAP